MANKKKKIIERQDYSCKKLSKYDTISYSEVLRLCRDKNISVYRKSVVQLRAELNDRHIDE